MKWFTPLLCFCALTSTSLMAFDEEYYEMYDESLLPEEELEEVLYAPELSFSEEPEELADSSSLFALQEERTELPSDFLRDKLMPIGLPVVSLFHSARESLFFNTHFSHSHPLEATGDFFLLPARYLFGGKRVQIQTEEGQKSYKVDQHFTYRKKHWLKTITSIATLPLSYTVGVVCKGLSYLSPSVRRKHRELKKQLTTPSDAIVSRVHEKYDLPDLYSEEVVPCLNYDRPIGLTRKQKIEINALQEISDLLDQYEIPYWIDCGTYLGAYRYGGIIPWDWDIDLAIFVDDHDNVKRLLASLDSDKYQIQDWSSYSKPKTFLKLYVKETKNFIDIYHYQVNEKKQEVGYLFTYIDSPFPDSWKASEMKCIKPLTYAQMFPLRQAEFDGLIVWAPRDTVAFLESKYGPNLEPTMVWNKETNSYEKVLDHPYYQ